MGITRTTRRSFPFFKREVRVVLENLICKKSLKEFATEVATIFKPEIPDILNVEGSQTIQDLRGRPEAQNGAEVGREVLLRIQGLAKRGFSDEKVFFEATVESKFKEFKEGKIIYSLSTNVPDGFEFSDLKAILASQEVELTKIELGLDYFENKEFPFLGIRLQGLNERFFISLANQEAPAPGSVINGRIESSNAQIPDGFSRKMKNKAEILAGIAGIAEITTEIKH